MTPEEEAHPGCGGRLQAKGKRAKRIQTQAGEVQVKREYYYYEVYGTGFSPSDEQMGLVGGLYSAGLGQHDVAPQEPSYPTAQSRQSHLQCRSSTY
jgi:hypothetical protein